MKKTFYFIIIGLLVLTLILWFMPTVRLTLQAKQEFQNNTQQGLIYEQFKNMRPSTYNFIFV